MPAKLTRRRLMGRIVIATALMPLFLPDLAAAGEGSWPDLRSELYGERFLGVSDDVISIDVPYRTTNDARTGVTVRMAAPEGHTFKGFQLILDENPMPVSAQLAFARPLADFEFAATMRVNGPTPVHAVAELDNGQLFMAESFIKTSGQGACAAPPGTDPVMALETLGQMELIVRPLNDTASLVRHLRNGHSSDLALDVEISHPSHSGMQRDQVSLLYIPARYVDTLEIDLNGAPFATMTGSISLSENPQVTLSVPSGTRRVRAKLTDSDGTVSEAERDLTDY
ncbi:quinoprotein dehydrogenase-associated SoxYZ-like carrier [uncultured Roseibium sp.]|uniref:quinoprotein dehydrogenase-associated SoxYZ-like carrier n=1 Tax=uncultured Roseibium sp. TaxID=1936171 RepID=UPI0032162789